MIYKQPTAPIIICAKIWCFLILLKIYADIDSQVHAYSDYEKQELFNSGAEAVVLALPDHRIGFSILNGIKFYCVDHLHTVFQLETNSKFTSLPKQNKSSTCTINHFRICCV